MDENNQTQTTGMSDEMTTDTAAPMTEGEEKKEEEVTPAE